jgi:hypothetical protein
MNHSNMETGTLTKEAIEEHIKSSKEIAGKHIVVGNPTNSFGAVFRMIEEYKKQQQSKSGDEDEKDA